MQLFNEINARKVNDEPNIFDKLFTNWIFVLIYLITIGFQIMMVELFGPFASTTSLPWKEWLICVAFGAGSLVVGVFLRLIRVDPDWGRIPPNPDAFKKDLPEWMERQASRAAADRQHKSVHDEKETAGLLH